MKQHDSSVILPRHVADVDSGARHPANRKRNRNEHKKNAFFSFDCPL